MREYPRRTKWALIRYRRTGGFHHPRKTCPVYLMVAGVFYWMREPRSEDPYPRMGSRDVMGVVSWMTSWGGHTRWNAGDLQSPSCKRLLKPFSRSIRRTQVTPQRSRLHRSKAPDRKRSSCLPWTAPTWVLEVKQPWTNWNRRNQTNHRHDLEP